jgi:hypothetical protein
MKIPATTKPIASQSPTKMSHRMLPTVCTLPYPSLPGALGSAPGRSSQ